jgi:hypothetical protein
MTITADRASLELFSPSLYSLYNTFRRAVSESIEVFLPSTTTLSWPILAQ